MFWYILGVICLLSFIVGIIIAKKSYDDWIGVVMSTVSGFVLVFLLITIPMISNINLKNINEFKKQKEYIENHIVKDRIENAALTNKKIELNSWLINAQYSKENYSFYTLLPDEVMELTTIE